MNNRPGQGLRRLVGGALAAILLAGIVACGDTPPENLAKAADALRQQIINDRAEVNKRQADFNQQLGAERYAFLKAYTPDQNHANRFDQAKAKLDEAEAARKSQVEKVVNTYNDQRKEALETGIAAVNKHREEAKALAADPAQWADKVVAVKADPQKVLRDTAALVQDIESGCNILKTEVDKVKAAYEFNAGAIDAAFKPLPQLPLSATTANGLLRAEASAPSPNYAVMTQRAEEIKVAHATVESLKSKLAELSVRETHTLVDIRVDSSVMVTRTTWDYLQNWPSEHSHEYEIRVDVETANYFSKLEIDQVLAVDSSRGFKVEKGVARAQWDKLKIQSKNPKWHEGDTDAEWSYDGMEDIYCNKIRVVKNGKPDISGKPTKPDETYCSQYDTPADLAQGMYWVEAEEFSADMIGMDVYSKGAGDFVDQATTEATPPGMVYVGDTATGEWKTDEQDGDAVWVYYGPYAFFSQFIGGPRPFYHRNEWNEWRRFYKGKRPYLGTYNGMPRYGSKSPLFASRFPDSHFATSGLREATIRNAGPAARAGGPGRGK